MIGLLILGVTIGTTQTQVDKNLIALAATGKPSALDAVRKALHKGRTIPKLADRAQLPTTTNDTDVIRSKFVDAKGTAWALIHDRRKEDGWYDEPR